MEDQKRLENRRAGGPREIGGKKPDAKSRDTYGTAVETGYVERLLILMKLQMTLIYS